jgi:aspartyl-tRNA(Asn)/glutamyl-tRNA(Gln) amidotransferase subunit B
MLAGEGKRASAQGLAELLGMVEAGEVTRTQARDIFRDMLATGRSPAEVAGKTDVGVVSDEQAIGELVDKVLKESGVAEEAKNNSKAFNYLVGQVLKAERKADPKVVAKIIRKKLR